MLVKQWCGCVIDHFDRVYEIIYPCNRHKGLYNVMKVGRAKRDMIVFVTPTGTTFSERFK